MTIGIIGSGQVGGTLGRRWARHGHEVIFGTRGGRSEAILQLLEDSGPTARSASVPDAVQAASVILLSTPWDATEEALANAGDLSGKVLMDATNPLLPGLAGLSVGTTGSGAELVAKWAPGARVVKAFNACGYNIMANPDFPEGDALMFYCGDDPAARNIVATLAVDLGFDAIDAGPLSQARLLEPLAMLWINLAVKQGFGREIAFRLMRR